MQKRWIRWTVIVLVVLVAATLAISVVPSSHGDQPRSAPAGRSAPAHRLLPEPV